MAFWLLKTEPSSYSFADLAREGRTVWNGVRNAQALISLRAMCPGDEALIYHSGEERQVVGTASIEGAPYADPREDDPRFVVVDVRAGHTLPRPVTLAMLKRDPLFAMTPLVRQPRLSVLPLSAAQWQRVMELGGAEA